MGAQFSKKETVVMVAAPAAVEAVAPPRSASAAKRKLQPRRPRPTPTKADGDDGKKPKKKVRVTYKEDGSDDDDDDDDDCVVMSPPKKKTKTTTNDRNSSSKKAPARAPRSSQKKKKKTKEASSTSSSSSIALSEFEKRVEATRKLFGDSGSKIKVEGSLNALVSTDGKTRVDATFLGEGAHSTVYSLNGGSCDDVVAKWGIPLSKKDMNSKVIGQPERNKTWRETHVHGEVINKFIVDGVSPHFPLMHGWYVAPTAGRFVMLLERAECDLAQWAKDADRSENEWLVVLFQLYHALAAMQSRDITHGDVKWGNFLMRRTDTHAAGGKGANSGGFYEYRVGKIAFHVPDIGWQAMVCDFGLAHVCDPLHEPAFYNDRGKRGWVARYGCDRSKRSADGNKIEIDGQLEVTRKWGSKDITFRNRDTNSTQTVKAASNEAVALSKDTFANDRRFDTRELAISFDNGGRMTIQSPCNLGGSHTIHGIKMPKKVVRIIRSVYIVDTSLKSKTRRNAEHCCADAVLVKLFSKVFPPKKKGEPIAKYEISNSPF